MPEKLSFQDMEGEDLATTVLTCEGDITDPSFPFKLQHLVTKLQHLISDEEKPIKVTKVEPWNSVRVTFNIPQEAAQRLRQLAERGDHVLRDLGILSVQIEGDQVITLTLAGQFNEPQEIVLRKTTENQNDVTSVSFNLPTSEPVAGTSSAEPAHKSITQFLGHIVGGATVTPSSVNPTVKVERPEVPSKSDSSLSFCSPNVIAPSSSEPIPFLPTSASVTSPASVAGTSHTPPLTSSKQQPGFGPFPFASMTHAMSTKQNSNSSPQYQSMVHIQSTHPRIPFTASSSLLASAARGNPSCSTTIVASTSACTPQSTSNPVLHKSQRTLSKAIFNNIVSRVSAPSAAPSTSRANVALSSPLLVNLLQSETSNIQPHNKLMPPPASSTSQTPKRKRKPRKSKEKPFDDSSNVPSPTFSTSPSPPSTPSSAGLRSPVGFDPLSVLGQSFNVPISNIPLSPPSSQFSNVQPQVQGQSPISSRHPLGKIPSSAASIHPQAQGQPPVSLHSQVPVPPVVPSGHRHVQMQQTVSAIQRQASGHPSVPNIHPQAEGQPQVHTGNLPLHTHIPVGVPPVSRSPIALQTYAMSSTRGVTLNTSRLLYPSNREHLPLTKMSDNVTRDIAQVKPCEKVSTSPSTTSTSTPESNPFPSPPPSADGKTKHLINPFTGQLEAMPPSDDEEEDESIGSLPPFPDFEIDTSENGQSERSLSDGGKDNNLSSDTDSGISKSHTDISQSSTECGPFESTRDAKKLEIVPKVENLTATASVTSGPGEKLKLRLKLDPKTIRETKDSEVKEKRKESGSQFNQKIDVAVVNIPGLKKGTSSGSVSSVPEPRVPPLHISLRGPNAAVVVSPRKDDLKPRYVSAKDDYSVCDTVPKTSQKKARSPRSVRSTELAGIVSSISGRIADLSEKKCKGNSLKEPVKGKDDFWNQNVKNMSGGGIVEMSDKVSINRVSGYNAYLSSSPMGNVSASQKKASVTGRESCKQGVIPSTSLTSENVSIHTVVNPKSQLPLQLTTASETASQVSVINTQAQTKGTNPSVQAMQPFPERTANSVLGGITNHIQEKAAVELSIICPGGHKDNTLAGATKSPSNMQNNYLPHCPSAQLDHKSNIHNFLPTDQIQHTSASSISVVSTVPISSHANSVITQPVCSVEVVTAISTLPKQVGVLSDANLPMPVIRKDNLKPLTPVASSTSCDTIHQTSNQCNISLLHFSTAEHVNNNPLTASRDAVQNNKSYVNINSGSVQKNDKSVIREVQRNAAVNKEQIVNHGEKSVKDVNNVNDIESTANARLISTGNVKHISLKDSQDVKNSSFHNHTGMCDSLLTNCLPISKQEIVKDIDVSEKGLHVIEVKNPPIAQIITVDSLPIPAHVIEVPSTQTSPAVPKSLAKSGLTVEVSSIPSLIPSCGSAFLSSRNVIMVQDQEDVLSLSGRMSPTVHCSRTLISKNSEGFQKSHVLNCSGSKTLLLNHVDLKEHHNSPIASGNNKNEQNSSTAPSEESSMDSIDEERKRCMLLSEVPTSTPGPPNVLHERSSTVSLDCNASTPVNSNVLMENKSMSKEVNCASPVTNQSVLKVVATPTASRTASEGSIYQVTEHKTDGLLTISMGEEHVKWELSAKKNNIQSNSSSEISESRSRNNTAAETTLPECSASEVHLSIPGGTIPQVSQLLLAKKTDCQPVSTEKPLSVSCKAPNTAKKDHMEPSSKNENIFISEQNTLGESLKKENVIPNESATVVCTTSSSIVTSFLSQGKYLSPEAAGSSGRVRLIFKGSGQHSVLSGSNSPTSVVVPLNSTKTVPIKLVTLPGGASGLSVRSTSNPAVVEIIGPKSASSHSSPSSGNPHSSSPVRLVVSKVSPGVSSSNQSGSSGIRNRVVVKSVVVTGTSSSLKIVSATKGTVCSTTTQIAPSSTVIATSAAGSTNANSFATSLSLTPTCISNPSSEEEVLVPALSESTVARAGYSSSVNDAAVAHNDRGNEINSNSDSCILEPLKNISNEEKVKCSSTSNTDCIAPELVKPVSLGNKIASSQLSKKPFPRENECVQIPNESSNMNNVLESGISANRTSKNMVKDCIHVKDSNEIHSESMPLFNSEPNEHTTDSVLHGQSSVMVSSSSEISDSNCSNITINPCLRLVAENMDAVAKAKLCEPPIQTEQYPVKMSNVNKVEESDKNQSYEVIQKPIEHDYDTGLCDRTSPSVTSTVSQISGSQVGLHSKGDEFKDGICEIVDTKMKNKEGNLEKQLIRPFKEPKHEEEERLIDALEQELSGCEDLGRVEQSLVDISLVYSKPLKRKCSENAAELIKACMGVEDGPKRMVLSKSKPSEEILEKLDGEKFEEHVRMNLRVRRDDGIRKGPTFNSDCSSDEELALSELVNKSRARERTNVCNTPPEPNCRAARRRSGSNESRQGDEPKGRTSRDNSKRETKREEPLKKMPERSKRGLTKETIEVVPVKRRRYSKDGHR